VQDAVAEVLDSRRHHQARSRLVVGDEDLHGSSESAC
jgi:hypothetical protein